MVFRFGRTAHHQTIATFGSPHTAARARVDVVDALRRQCARAADIVFEPGVTTVDDRVAGAQQIAERHDGLLGRPARRHHDPHRARRRE